MLKNEIERIGIQDNPSKTLFNKLYNNENTMSSSSYINRFGKTWEEIMEMIGMTYDKKKVASENGKLGKGVKRDKPYATKWSKYSDDDLYEVVKTELLKKEIQTMEDYNTKRDIENTPSLSYVKKRFGAWAPLVNRVYNKTKGEKQK